MVGFTVLQKIVVYEKTMLGYSLLPSRTPSPAPVPFPPLSSSLRVQI